MLIFFPFFITLFILQLYLTIMYHISTAQEKSVTKMRGCEKLHQIHSNELFFTSEKDVRFESAIHTFSGSDY